MNDTDTDIKWIMSIMEEVPDIVIIPLCGSFLLTAMAIVVLIGDKFLGKCTNFTSFCKSNDVRMFVIAAAFFWPVTMVVAPIICVLVGIVQCLLWKRGFEYQTFSPKIVTRLPLKYCNSAHECTICLEPFTHQSDCAFEASTSDCRSELQQPTDSTNAVPASSVMNNSTSIVIDRSDASDSDLNISDHDTVSDTTEVMCKKYAIILQCSNRKRYKNATCVTSCGHCFHYKCLVQALNHDRMCPNCRQFIDLQRCYAIHQPEIEADMMKEPRLVCSWCPLPRYNVTTNQQTV